MSGAKSQQLHLLLRRKHQYHLLQQRPRELIPMYLLQLLVSDRVLPVPMVVAVLTELLHLLQWSKRRQNNWRRNDKLRHSLGVLFQVLFLFPLQHRDRHQSESQLRHHQWQRLQLRHLQLPHLPQRWKLICLTLVALILHLLLHRQPL